MTDAELRVAQTAGDKCLAIGATLGAEVEHQPLLTGREGIGQVFARLLGKFDTWRRKEAQSANPCTKRINVLAHSMGNCVLRNALQTWAKKDAHGDMPQLFRNVFMAAADVVNHTLEPGESGQYIAQSARNVVV